MGSVGILLLRIWILVIAIALLTLSSLCFVHERCRILKYSYHEWVMNEFERNTDWISTLLAVIIILSYTYSLLGKPVVQRFVRAFCMFVLAGFAIFSAILYIGARKDDFYSGYLLFTAGPFILVEMGWALLETRPNQPNEGQNCKQNPNIITASPEMPNGDNISTSPIQYVYPSPLPQPQAVTPSAYFTTADPLSVNVKRSPQSQSEMAMAPSPQNREIPQPSHPTQSTALPSALTPQLLPQTAQFYGTPQLLPQAPQLYGTPQQGLK